MFNKGQEQQELIELRELVEQLGRRLEGVEEQLATLSATPSDDSGAAPKLVAVGPGRAAVSPELETEGGLATDRGGKKAKAGRRRRKEKGKRERGAAKQNRRRKQPPSPPQ